MADMEEKTRRDWLTFRGSLSLILGGLAVVLTAVCALAFSIFVQRSVQSRREVVETHAVPVHLRQAIDDLESTQHP